MYEAVPFGLINAHTAFMSVLNKVFKDYTDFFAMVYLDVILVHSKSWDEHVRHLKLVLDQLRKHKLYAKMSNCTFKVQEMDYLGSVLGTGKWAVNPNKTKEIEVWETLTNKKKLQLFLVLVNYYRRFKRNGS